MTNRGLLSMTLVLRLSMAWYFLYAGISKLMNPAWSAAGYLNSAKTFSGFYQWLASPGNIVWVDFLNEWGLTLVGISLALGLFTRASAFAGALMLLLYYFPVLDFPMVDKYSYIVDSHIREIFVLAYLIIARAGMFYGLDGIVKNSRFGSSVLFRWVA